MEMAGTIVRRIAGERGFYTFVVAVLGLGIGVATATFTAVDAALLRPLAYPESHRLVYVQATLMGPSGEVQRYLVSPANFVEMRARSRGIASLDAAVAESFDWIEGDVPARLTGARVTAGLFATLGVEPIAGRTFRPDDAERSVALVAEGLWERAFGRDPGVVGRTIDLGGTTHEVLGVVSDAAAFPTSTEVWVPYRPDDVPDALRHGGSLQVVGRLAETATLDAASDEMNGIAIDLATLYPSNNGGRGIEIGPLREPWVRTARTVMMALMAAVMAFLCATVVNVAGLFLVRAGRRSRLLAVRSALGATRGRLLGDALLEALLLTVAATCLGLALATFVTPLLVEAIGAVPPGGRPSAIDPRTLVFAFFATGVTCLVCAVGPAMLASAVRPAAVLGASARGGTPSSGQRRLQSAVVSGQTVVGVVLLIFASASGARFLELIAVSPGFGERPALAIRIPVSDARFPTHEERTAFATGLSRTLRELPGVTAAGATDVLPVGDPNANWALSIESRPPDDPTAFEVARGRLVTPGYLEAAGIEVVRGRTLTESDGDGSSPVVVVSRFFADRYWAGTDPVGQRIKRRTFDSPFPWLTVVGVVEDVRDGGPGTEIGATVYFPYAQHDSRLGRELSFVVRSDRPAQTLVPAIRDRLSALDPLAPVVSVRTLDELVDDALLPERTTGVALGTFALGGLLLLGLGTYGALSRTVLDRTRELGLRTALGAPGRQVLGSVLSGAARFVLLGLVLGLALGPAVVAWANLGFAAGLEVPGWAYPLAGGLVLTVGLVAALVPGLRALRVSPLIALRSE